jgi:hypothetical protein
VAQVAVYKTHKYSVGRTYNCWMLYLLVHRVTRRLNQRRSVRLTSSANKCFITSQIFTAVVSFLTYTDNSFDGLFFKIRMTSYRIKRKILWLMRISQLCSYGQWNVQSFESETRQNMSWDSTMIRSHMINILRILWNHPQHCFGIRSHEQLWTVQ